MPAFALVCDVEWSGTTCPGTTASLDVEQAALVAAPFDWALIDPADLGELFVAGAGIVLTFWAISYGAAAVLDVLRKS